MLAYLSGLLLFHQYNAHSPILYSLHTQTAKLMEVFLADTPIAPVTFSSKTPLRSILKNKMEENASAESFSEDDSLAATTVKLRVEQVKRTYLELHHQQYDLVLKQAQSFDSSIIQYAQEWLEVISVRVSSNVIQFKELSESLQHYITKVEKLKAHQKSNKVKPSPKLQRNEIKLRGVREAHDNMGENLYKLMEEVTMRAWKDLLPLLMKSIQMDLFQAEEERRVIWNDLEKVLEALGAISAQYGVTADGRLKRLKKDHIDLLYTGTHSSHRTQVKSGAGGATPPVPSTQVKSSSGSAETVLSQPLRSIKESTVKIITNTEEAREDESTPPYPLPNTIKVMEEPSSFKIVHTFTEDAREDELPPSSETW
jgi:hypothetical protein